MTKNSRRGSVLVHVLVTGVIVAFVAAGLMRLVMMNYLAVDRMSKNASNRKEAEAMLNRVVTYWNQNQLCSSIPAPNAVTCSGSTVGTCGCSCPDTTSVPRIVTSNVGGRCQVSLVSSDAQ